MASSVFFKFKSQKEPTRVEFDGTGISVFELKREIISRSGLGDGTDFDLHIYTDDNSEEYDDDTTIVPRSTTVIARRQPALKPGAGRAARYVSGKMPVSAKNASRREHAAKSSAAPNPSASAINQMNTALTEEEKMAAMFAAQSEHWSAQQEELSHQAPVFKAGSKRPANVPDHDPPSGYICYRCGNKGHWIQLCPTNDDPDFDNRPRVKRTTGIPRSFLQKVDKSVVLAHNEGDDSKRPSGIMVNAEGDFVIAEPDKASWERFQAKTKSSSASKEAQAESKEVHERGLECPIDKKLFIEPMKTSCCKKTFCNDCITNALIESDFVCPSCQTEGVLIDDLIPDEETAKQIQDYLKEKETAKSPPPPTPPGAEPEKDEGGKAKAGGETDGAESGDEVKPMPRNDDSKGGETGLEAAAVPKEELAAGVGQQLVAEAKVKSGGNASPKEAKAAEQNPRKRPADDFLDNPNIPKGPKAMQSQQRVNPMSNMMNGMPNMGVNGMMFNGMGMMPNMMTASMPGMNMNMGMPMGGMQMAGMSMTGMPTMGMAGYGGMHAGWGMNGMHGVATGMNGFHAPMQAGPMATGPMATGPMAVGPMGGNLMGGGAAMGGPVQGFAGGGGNFVQAGGGGGGGGGGGDDDAYFRKPVNPHRHQNKQRRVRPSDYREL